MMTPMRSLCRRKRAGGEVLADTKDEGLRSMFCDIGDFCKAFAPFDTRRLTLRHRLADSSGRVPTDILECRPGTAAPHPPSGHHAWRKMTEARFMVQTMGIDIEKEKRLKLGMSLPIADGTEPTGNVVARGARALEAHGFDSAWFFDSIGRGRMSIEPLTGAAVAATATQRIALGLGVLQVPLRHPVELAHRILTAQLLCEGRLVLGVGAGSTRGDFEALGQDFEARFQTLDENLEIMRRLWAGENVGAANLTPLPAVKGGPPVLIGSWRGGRWIARAAQVFDGWIASGFYTGYDTIARGLRAYRDAGGKRATVTNISIDLRADEALADSDHTFHLKCPPEVAAERLGRLAALGFDEAVLVHRGPGAPDLAAIRALLPG